jgi:hypothetical protein
MSEYTDRERALIIYSNIADACARIEFSSERTLLDVQARIFENFRENPNLRKLLIEVTEEAYHLKEKYNERATPTTT